MPAAAVGLEVEGGDDPVADEDRKGEVAVAALVLRDIGLEDVIVAEEEAEALALDDERVERREDVDRRFCGSGTASRISGRAQCSCLPAPSMATGTSSFFRTFASISARIAGFRETSP